MAKQEWQPVTSGRLLAFVTGLLIFLWLLLRSEPGFILILDHANLLFHEAGHPLVGLFSTRLEPYGGTLGQLAFPALLIGAFWRRRQPVELAVCALWFCENGLNIARYLADARRVELPLVGGGDHDWNTILFRWGLLQWDTSLATTLRILAWACGAAICSWIFLRAWEDRHRTRNLDTPAPLLP
jgi:hypothetical protein